MLPTAMRSPENRPSATSGSLAGKWSKNRIPIFCDTRKGFITRPSNRPVHGTDPAPLGSATIHLAPTYVPPIITPPASATVDSVSICQGNLNNADGSCATDLTSRKLTVVARFHGATPGHSQLTDH